MTLAIWILTNFAVYLFMGWVLMLAVGAIHSAAPSIPTFSFWMSVLIMFVITFLTNMIRGTKD